MALEGTVWSSLYTPKTTNYFNCSLYSEVPPTLVTQQGGARIVLFDKIKVCQADAKDLGISRGKTHAMSYMLESE